MIEAAAVIVGEVAGTVFHVYEIAAVMLAISVTEPPTQIEFVTGKILMLGKGNTYCEMVLVDLQPREFVA